MKNKNYDTAVSDFTTFMYQRGYRGKYTLLHPGTNHPGMSGSLSACLEKFLTGYDLTEQTRDTFRLETYADQAYRLRCTFKLQYDQVKGFLIRKIDITNTLTEQNRTYNLSVNHQVPGSVAIQGLFPKPKPWDHIRKGKFRL